MVHYYTENQHYNDSVFQMSLCIFCCLLKYLHNDMTSPSAPTSTVGEQTAAILHLAIFSGVASGVIVCHILKRNSVESGKL